MNMKTNIVALCIATLVFCHASAQNFFWSTADFETGATPTDNVNPFIDGTTGTVFLYYEAGGSNIIEGIDLDFSWDINGIVGFTAAETFDADILLNGEFDLDDRWGDFTGPANEVSADAVDGFLTVNTINGSGILQQNIPGVLNGAGIDFVDTLFDTTANAFLVGSFDYEFLNFDVGNLATLQVEGLVVNEGVDINGQFTNITFGVVPEPTSTGILALGLASLFVRRRKQL